MIISERDHLEKLEAAKPLQWLIDELSNCPTEALVGKLEENIVWNRPRGDLYHWISLLNRFDTLLETQVNKYGLAEKTVKPHVMDQSDEKLLVAVLEFSAMLLDNCANRVIYSSTHRLYDLINTFSISVRLSTLKVCNIIAERHCQTNASKYYAPQEVKNKFFEFARVFPPVSHSSSSQTYSLLDVCKNTEVPSKWKMLDFEYYNSNPRPQSEQQLHLSPNKNKRKLKRSALNTQSQKHQKLPQSSQKSSTVKDEGLQHFIINEAQLKKMSFQKIYDRAIGQIPPESYFQFGLKVAVAKAFNSSSSSSSKLKFQLLSIKCLSVAFLTLMAGTSVVSSQLFEQEQHLFSFLADLINPDNMAVVPKEVHFHAVKTFENISMRRVWGSEIIRTLGGNISHGLMYHKIRVVYKDIKEGKEFDERAVIQFFNMLANIIDTKGLSQILINAGLLQLLMGFMSLRSNNRWICSGAVHLISLLLQQQPDYLEEFIEADGFKLLREAIDYEVRFALDNPDFGGGPPKHSVVYYKMTFRQHNYIRTLLKFVLYFIQSDSGDRIRNLYDSPLLDTFDVILHNADSLGPEALSNTLTIITSIIHTEPTAFSILNEAGLIETFLQGFKGLFKKSDELLMALPEVIGAICLNKTGLEKVISSNVIGTYLDVFKDVSYARLLVKEDNSCNMGATFDELSRHYPDLKETIVDNIARIVKELPDIVRQHFEDVNFYHSTSGSLYSSRDEQVLDDEKDASGLPTWDASDGGYLVDNLSTFLSELVQTHQRWNVLIKKIPIEDWLNLMRIPRAPYDYVLSNGLFAIAGLLRFFDDEDRKYGLPYLLKTIQEPLAELHDFIHYESDEVCFFEQFNGSEEDAAKGGHYLRLLNEVNYLLFVLTDVFVTPNNLFAIRMTQLAEFFTSDEGAKMLQDLILLFRRVTLDEINLQHSTPSAAVKSTTFFQTIDFSPVQITLGEPQDNKNKKFDRTSAKFKNTLVIRFHINRIQTWLGYIFATLTRMGVQKRYDPGTFTPKMTIQITDAFTEGYLGLFDKVRISNPAKLAAYNLIVLNSLNSLMVTKARPHEQVVSTLAIMIMQKGGFRKIRNLCWPYIAQLKSFEPKKMEEIADLKFVEFSIESLSSNVVKQFLTTVSKIINHASLMDIPAVSTLYSDHISGTTTYQYEVTVSFVIQARLYAFGILSELLNKDTGIMSDDRNVTNFSLPIIELIIYISKVVYSSAGEDHVRIHSGKLYPLDWKVARPSTYKLEYLENVVGLEEHIALDILKMVEGDISQLAQPEFDFGFYDRNDLASKSAQIYSKMVERPYVAPAAVPVEPQYSNLQTHDELIFVRNGNELDFLDQWLMILQFFPKAVFRVSDLLLEVFSKSVYGRKIDFEATVFVTIFEYIQSFDLDSTDNDSKAAIMLHLFGLLLQEDTIFYNCQSSLEDALTVLTDAIKPQYANREWFSKALLSYERVFADSQIPAVDKIRVASNAFMQKFVDVYRIEDEISQSVLRALLGIKEFTNTESALSVCRVLVLYAKNSENVSAIVESGILKLLISSARLNIKDSKAFAFQSSLILLIRECLETPAFIKDVMTHELDKTVGNKLLRHKGLPAILRENSPLVLRSDDIFVDAVSPMLYLDNVQVPLTSLTVHYVDPDHAVTGGSKVEDDVEMEDANPALIEKNSGVVHFLLSEIMKTSAQNFVSSPAEEIEAHRKFKEERQKDFKSKEQFKYNPMSNENCAYLAFLLQMLTELLCSYKQSKLEFLTFSKKLEAGEQLKPRSTALNVLIHKLVSTNKFVVPEGPEFERRCFISTLARAAIFAFISTPIAKENEKPDGKASSPDINFIRQFTSDVLLKILKETNNSDHYVNERYSKVFDLVELIGSLISKTRTQFGNILEKDIVAFDSYFMSKIMLEKGLPHEISNVLSNLDLNYPYASRISNTCLKALNHLGHSKKEHQNLFKQGATDGDEEEMETEDLEAREDTPDLFRNSTLGMYDIEDMSDYEYDDDNFDYDEGEGLDIVYSDSDIASENSDLDEDEDGAELEEVGDSDMDDDDLASHIDEDDIQSIVSDSEEEDDIEILHDPDLAIQIHGQIGDEDDYSEDDYSDSESGDVEDEYYSGLSFDEDDDISTGDEGLLDEWAANYEAEGGDLGDLEEFGEEGDARDLFEREADARTPPTVISHDDDSDEDLDMEREESSDEASLNISILANGGTEFHVHSSSRRPVESNEAALVNPLLQSSDASASRITQMRRVNPSNPTQLPDFMDFMSNASGLFEGRFPLRDDGVSPLTQLFRMLGGQDSRARANDNLKNLNIKSTQQRWAEFTAMFYKNTAQRDACRLGPRIINAIFDQSVALSEKEKAERKKLEEKKRLEEEERRKEAEERAKNEADRADDTDSSLEPVYVSIGDRQVNIAGTDIDPEFFEALPDDMREEVFTQHIRERRATASSETGGAREVDPEFLNALPESLRQEILSQEQFESHYSNFESAIQDEEVEEPIASHAPQRTTAGDAESKDKEKQKLFFSPLVDKSGVASLLRLIFAPESYHHGETLHRTLEYLCYNKQTRSEVMGLLLSFLLDGISDYRALEKTFIQLSARSLALTQPAKGDSQLSSNGFKEATLSKFPTNTSPLAVAYQAIDSIKYLLESDPHMRYYFLIEHENFSTLRKFNRQKSLSPSAAKSLKYPINSLLKLLNQRIVKNESSLMEILSRTLQIATRPLSSLKQDSKLGLKEDASSNAADATGAAVDDDDNSQDSDTSMKNASSPENSTSPDKLKGGIAPPFVPDHNLERIINILLADECSGRTFRQTLSAMQSLSVLPNAQKVFPVSLSEKATNLGQSLVSDLKSLVSVIENVDSTEGLEGSVLIRFTPASSDQAKLLRVLTALDYLFDTKDRDLKLHELKALTRLYRSLALGPLWGALSDALRVLQEKSYLSHISSVLLPLIEALMVVCKHSKVKELPIKEAIKYEAKKPDVAKEPIENLFFTFTNEHKKILNLMVRTNPKLMSGPFSMLVRNPHVLEFDNKKNFFDRKLHQENTTKSTLTVNVRRDQVFLDSFRSLFYKPNEEFKNSKLDIKFRGEDGVDAGGVTREWYQVLSRQMFNADYALFTPVAADKTTFHPNRTSWVNPEHLSFFKFIGRIIGKAVYDGNFLDCHFSRAVYKHILGIPVSLKDMETLDLDYYKSLVWMLENDITDIIVETFAVETDDYGEHKVIELIPDGGNVPVTEENKQEYVHRIVEYRLQTSIAEQMENLLLGFHEIIPKDLIAIFSEQEVELLISGLPDIDVDDWKNNTTYNNYSASSPQIQWFWRAVRSFDVEERAKLLQFATGTSKVPLHGFKELAGVNGVSKFSIHRDYGSTDRLPSSHTCFNQIDLPEYDSYETLRGAIIVAINEGREGFGLV